MTLTFIHISDTHISASRDYHPDWVHSNTNDPNISVERLHRVISTLPFNYDFILHTGDVCADPTKADCLIARDLLCRFDKPMYILPGNHDSADMLMTYMHDGSRLHILRDSCVQIDDYQLITLDTNGLGNAHSPTIGYEQILWFDKQVQKIQRKTIIATHHPLIKTGVAWIDNQMRVQNGEALHHLLKPHANHLCGVFHGHIHQPANSYYDGVMYVSCPSTWYNLHADPTTQTDTDDLTMPGGFNVVMVRENRTFIRRYVL